MAAELVRLGRRNKTERAGKKIELPKTGIIKKTKRRAQLLRRCDGSSVKASSITARMGAKSQGRSEMTAINPAERNRERWRSKGIKFTEAEVKRGCHNK